MNSFRRTDFDTLAAVYACILVNNREVVLDLDSVDGARAHAAATGDTGDLAGAPRDSRRPVVGACDVCRELVFGDELNQLLRAGFDTFAACGAEIVVYLGDAVLDIDRVELTDSDTIAETETAVRAGIRAGEEAVR